MPKYNVTLYYATSAKIEVEAVDEEDAIDVARETISEQVLLDGLQSNGSPDVELIKDEDDENF